MSTKDFEVAWKELSPIQKQAANWDEGSLLVLAGPGSGKTRVLTCRIARILDTSVGKNFRVLGLTFTNKAADEMRGRVEKYVPGQEARFFLGTIHSFCADILRQHGTHLNIAPNFNIYGQEADLQEILNDAVNDDKYKPDLMGKITPKTLQVVQRLKSRLILPEECRDKFENVDVGNVMGIVYSAYEEQLAKRNALDFNSLILKAYQLFTKFPAFAKRYRAVYPYICVDEFQDTNQAQYALLRALCGGQYKNVFVVADDDQIIYQWNGASHKRIHEFADDFSPRIIQLPTNYRCPPEVVELANNLIEHNFSRHPNKEPNLAFRKSSGKPVVRLLGGLPSVNEEVAEMARDIKTAHASTLGSVAVLARSRRLLERAHQALFNEGLTATILQRKDEFESTPFVWLHSVLRLANDRQNRHCLEAVCGSFAQLTTIESDPERIATQSRVSDLSYLQHWVNDLSGKTRGTLAGEAIEKLSRLLSGRADFRSFATFAIDWFDRLQAEKQVSVDPMAEAFACYKEERLVWEQLTIEIVGLLGDELSLESFLQELEMRSKEAPPRSDTVLLMTIHGAKGREFDHVYLIGLVEDEMPSFQSRQKGSNSLEMEEERRNCFVAITRTKETLTLSYAERYNGWPKKPSRFLAEMGIVEAQYGEVP